MLKSPLNPNRSTNLFVRPSQECISVGKLRIFMLGEGLPYLLHFPAHNFLPHRPLLSQRIYLNTFSFLNAATGTRKLKLRIGSEWSPTTQWFIMHFSQRELTFTFGMCCRLSVRRLSGCNVRAPYSAGWNFRFRQCFYAFGTLAILETLIGIGTPLSGLNASGVAKYSDFGPIECYISGTVQDMR